MVKFFLLFCLVLVFSLDAFTYWGEEIFPFARFLSSCLISHVNYEVLGRNAREDNDLMMIIE